MSKLLNNVVLIFFICGWFDLSFVLFYPTPDVFDMIYIWRLLRTYYSIMCLLLFSNHSNTLRLDSYYIRFSLTSFTSMMNLKNKLTRIREYHKGPFIIGPPVLNFLIPSGVVLTVLV